MAEAIEAANTEQGMEEHPAYEYSEGTVKRRRTNQLPASMPASVQGENVNMGANQTVVGGDNVGGNQTKIETQVVINVGDVSEKGDSEFNLISVRQQLMQEYKNTRGTLPLLPGMPEECATMEDLFVDLKIVKEDKKPCRILTKELRSCGELVCMKRQNVDRNEEERVKRVLVKGKPGIGKSSTVSKLAYDWACNDQDSPVSEYQLLFAITINEIDNDTDLISIIQDQLLKKVSGEALRAYIQSHASSICLLLDGYDEATEHFLQCKDIKDMLCSKWLAEACVIVTTRVNEVGKFCQSYGPHAQVEITGFSKESRKEYVDHFFIAYEKNDSNDEDDGDDDDDHDNDGDNDDDDEKDSGGDVGGCRRRHYHRGRKFLKSLLRASHLHQLSIIPIILSMLCLLWTDNAALPSSVTALYKEVILHLANHAGAKRKNDHLDLDIEDWVDKVLFLVGKVAIQGLFEDKVLFKATDFQCDLLEEALLLGIVTKERKRSRLSVTYSVTFLHKTFQEFCAAMYWGHLIDTDRKKFDQHLQQIREENVFEMDYLLRFACGLSVKVAESILPHVVQIMCHHNQLKYDNGKIRNIYRNICQQIPLFLLHETESNNAYVKESYILHSLLKPLYSTIVVREVYFENDEFRQLFLSYLTPLKHNLGNDTKVHRPWLADVIHVEFVDLLTVIQAILKGFAQIANMIDQCKMSEWQSSQQYLQLNRDNDTQQTGALQSGLSIEYLELSYSHIRESVEYLAEAYKYMPRLRHLNLNKSMLEPSHCAALFEGFISAGKMLSQQDEMSSDVQVCGSGTSLGGLSIEHLDLSFNNIGDSVDKLAQAYRYMPRLRRLDLRGSKLAFLQPSHCASIFDAFIAAGKMLSQQDGMSSDAQSNWSDTSEVGLGIEHLDLSFNDIGDSVDKLAHAYRYMPRLRRLDLRGSKLAFLQPSHCAALFEGFVAAGEILSQQDQISSDAQCNMSGASEVGLGIEHLDLCGNTIGESVDKLLQALRYMPHLTYIGVIQCGLDKKSQQRLHEETNLKCEVRH